MRILVTGSKGMLGSQVCDVVTRETMHEAIAVDHSIDASDWLSVNNVIVKSRPDAIINCVGVRDLGPFPMILANAVVPHVLASFNIPMVHMSTDCVFSGITGVDHWYSSTRAPEPNTLYGRSKLAGEVQAEHVVNVRGSFIGIRHGFLRWLLDARGRVDIWKNAYWNGTDVKTMAKQLVTLAECIDPHPNVLHVASSTFMTKAAMAQKIADALDLEVTFNIVDEPFVRRVLLPDIEFEPVETMLKRLMAG